MVDLHGDEPVRSMAQEIERLRSENARLADERRALEAETDTQAIDLAGERAGMKAARSAIDVLCRQRDAAVAERDALRAAVESVRRINTGRARQTHGNDFESGMAKALWDVKETLDAHLGLEGEEDRASA